VIKFRQAGAHDNAADPRGTAAGDGPRHCNLVGDGPAAKRIDENADDVAGRRQDEFGRDEEMTVGEIIIAIIAKEMRVDTSRVSITSTMEELQIESLDAIQIIFEIEDRLQVSIPYDKSIHSLNSVGDIVNMVDRLLLEKRAVA
jgi:acyl carrier protein